MEAIPPARVPRAYRRACNACTATKRRCTKETPSCRRCAIKGLDCSYPPIRRTDSTSSETVADSQDPTLATDPDLDDLFLDIDFTSLENILPASDLHITTFDTPHHSNELAPASPNTLWFLASDSWHTAHIAPDQQAEYISDASLDAYTATLQSWFRQWTAETTCPLIHRKLYDQHMPRCLQDAFTTLATYHARTPATHKPILRILDDRAAELAASNAVQDPGGLSLRAHLARVHALLAYQVVRLFDGDIRMRARAESHAPLLASWNALLWDRTTAEMSAGNIGALSASPLVPLTPWGAWCVVESIRRTWLTVRFLQAVYGTVRDGVAGCPGGVVCSFGAGLWGAESEGEWMGKGKGKRLFVQSLEVGDLLREAPGSVDEFGHAIVVVSCGLERRERWVAEGVCERESYW